MAKKLDPRLLDILKQYDENPEEALWDCHGTWVAYHKAIERIAAKAGIRYQTPTVLVAEREAAAILVTGELNDRTEWSIGEAVINLNYKVSGRQAAYPFAMAEKRAKDRVVLKLIGLHGLVYSEEESDDFKPQSNSPQFGDKRNPRVREWHEGEEKREAATKSSAQLKRDGFWPDFERELDECDTLVKLERFKEEWRKKAVKDGWNTAFKTAAKDRIEGREKAIMNAMEADELAGVPLGTALRQSLNQHPINAG